VKILRGSARLRLRHGRPEQARLLVTAATDLATGLGDPAERAGCLEDTAELYAALGSRGPAIGTLHEAYDDHQPRAAGSVEEWTQATAVLMALTAQYNAERHPAGQRWCAEQAIALLDGGPETPVTDLGEDLFAAARRRFAALPEQGRRRLSADGRPAGPAFRTDMATSVVLALRDTVSFAGVLVPLALGLQQRRDGLDGLAEGSFGTAIAEATALGSRGDSLHVVALIAARRHSEAVALVRALPRDFPDDLRRDLAVAARDYPAAALLPHDEPGGWRDAVDHAEIALRTGHPGRARSVTATARDDYERWFAALDRDPFRLSVTDDVNARWLYLLAGEAALLDGDPAEALLLGDRLRALPILALLADPDPAHLDWRRATARWSTAYDLLAWSGLTVDAVRSPDPALALLDEAGVRELLDGAQLALESAEARIPRPSIPLPDLPDLAELRRHLPEGALLVQYLLAGDRLLIGVLDADVVDGAIVEVDADRVAGHITRVHATCTRTAWPGDAEASRQELARVLLAPVAAHLRRHRRIVLVPSGAMNLLPFTVLPFDGGVLGDEHILSVLPSTALLGRLPPPRPGTTVVVGDPAFANLRRLPGTRTEALVVARHHGVDAVVDDRASSTTVRGLLPAARLVHLATHGLVSEIAPTASSLALAEHDRLDVADLAGMRFDADLVVLSACDTGRGDVTVGGDIVGLSRQLIAAGAAAVVVSLWPVNDEVACVVMDEMHARLAGGTDPATALAEAQAAVRERTPRQRSERYAELARSVGMDPEPRTGLRSPHSPAPVADGRGLLRDARDWAAFVLVGRP
jgi:CHAT domain-containing protein